MILHPAVTDPNAKRHFKTLEQRLYAKLGDRLDFTYSVYTNSNTKIQVWCNVHNKFIYVRCGNLFQNNHSGCTDCGREKTNANNRKIAKVAGDSFATVCEKIHPDKYDYTMVWYRNAKKKVMIWCKTHKKFFWIVGSKLRNGDGCISCGHDTRTKPQRQEWVSKLQKIMKVKHGTNLQPVMISFSAMKNLMLVHCETCNVVYKTNAWSVCNGSTHIGCSSGGFNSSKPAILYYLRVETRNQVCWKIGITNLTVKERFRGADWKIITVLDEQHFEVGQDAYTEEQRIIKEYADFKYLGDPILIRGGNTELFTKDVLGWDSEY